MESKQILKKILPDIANRKEILNVSIDRGQGEGMQIEKWILIEMIANLIKLKDARVLTSVEGEHKYHRKKKKRGKLSKRFEHCDLWWRIGRAEHWLEVKTIVFAKNEQKGTLKDISKDLNKINRLRPKDVFHHLSIVFPVENEKINGYKKDISEIYQKNNLKIEEEWEQDIGSNKSIIFSLYKK